MTGAKFKPCMQHQAMLFPPDVSELIPEQSMVRVEDSIVDGMDASRLRALYTCPDGRKLPFAGERKTKTDRGFESTARVYECPDCGGCPLRKACFKSKDENARKRIQVNPRLTEFKQRASALLHTEKGSKLRKKRGVDVETVFGDIKRNYGFTRFTLRGLEKATLEFRLVAAGHNIRKLFRAQSAEMTGAGATE